MEKIGKAVLIIGTLLMLACLFWWYAHYTALIEAQKSDLVQRSTEVSAYLHCLYQEAFVQCGWLGQVNPPRPPIPLFWASSLLLISGVILKMISTPSKSNNTSK